jgi:hypothetical protein
METRPLVTEPTSVGTGFARRLHIVAKVGAVRDERGGWLPTHPSRCARRYTTTSAGSASAYSFWIGVALIAGAFVAVLVLVSRVDRS